MQTNGNKGFYVKRTSAVCSVVLSLTGCATDLRTSAVTDPSRTALQSGFVYYLPAASVTPTASLRIAGCPIDQKATDDLKGFNPKPLPPPITAVQFATSGDITVDQVRGKAVLIDYRELGDFLKTTSLTLERQPNGMLKSIGVTIEDQSPAVIADVAIIAADVALATVDPLAAISVAGGAAGVASKGNANANAANIIGQPPTTEDVRYIACRPETAKLVEDRAKTAKKKAADTDDLNQANTALANVLRNTDPGLTPTEVKLVHQYRDRIIGLIAALADDADTLGEIDAKLSIKLTLKKDADAGVDVIKDKGISLSATVDQLNMFITSHYVQIDAKVASGHVQDFQQRKCIRISSQSCISIADAPYIAHYLADVVLTAKPVAMPVDGYTPDFANAPTGQEHRTGRVHPSQGIIYVEPAQYAFTLTQRAFPPNELDPTVVLKAVKASVPQLGTYLALPVHAGFGEKVALSATFNSDGSLASASYGKPTAAGKAISGALAGLADKYVATYDAAQDRKLKMLKAKADQLAAQNALKADPLADLNAQIASVTGQALLAEANLRLSVATAKLANP